MRRLLVPVHWTLGWLARQEMSVLLGILLVVAGSWAFVELAGEVYEGDTAAFDEWVIDALRNPADPDLPRGPRWLVQVGVDITALGGTTVLTLMTCGVLGYLALQRKHGAVWLVAVAVLGGAIITGAMKFGFDRRRPSFNDELQWVATSSFPSGHSMLSAVVYLTLGTLLASMEPRRSIKLYFLGIALLLTLLVGLSRVYLGVHYPTDVMAGWTAGLVWAMLCWVVARYLQRRGKVETTLTREPKSPTNADGSLGGI